MQGKVKDWQKAVIAMLVIFGAMYGFITYVPMGQQAFQAMGQQASYAVGTGETIDTGTDTGLGDWSSATLRFRGQQIKTGTTATASYLAGNCTMIDNTQLSDCDDPEHSDGTFDTVTTSLGRGHLFEYWVYDKNDDGTGIVPFVMRGTANAENIKKTGNVYQGGTISLNCKDDADGSSGGSINNCRIVVEKGAADTTYLEIKEGSTNAAIPGPFLVTIEYNNTCYDEASVIEYAGGGYTVNTASVPDWLSTVEQTANVLDAYKVTLNPSAYTDMVMGTDNIQYGVLFDFNAVKIKLKFDAATGCDPGNSTNSESTDCTKAPLNGSTAVIQINVTAAGWDEDASGNFLFPTFEDADGTEPWGVAEANKAFCLM